MDERRVRLKFVLLSHGKQRGNKSLCAKQGTAFQEDVKGLKHFVMQLLSQNRFSIAEFTSCFLHLAWKEALFCLNSAANTPSSNLLTTANSVSPYTGLVCT